MPIPEQGNLFGDDVPSVTKLPLVADGWTRCLLCNLEYETSLVGEAFLGAPVAHENVCPRFKCSGCGAHFALLPMPLTKRYGPSPLCHKCSAGHTK